MADRDSGAAKRRRQRRLRQFFRRERLTVAMALEVPKIVCPPRAARTVLRAPQTVEQLVEAPTLVSLVRIFERTFDIPGRAGGRGVTGGLQGSLFAAEQIADTPAPHRGSSGSLQGVHPGKISTPLVAQIVDIPVPHGGRQDSDVPSAASSSGLPDTANQGGFRTFPCGKKCTDGSTLGVGTGCGLQFIHAGFSCERVLHGCSWRCVDAIP